MDLGQYLTLLGVTDLIAAGFLFTAWAVIGPVIEHPPFGRQSVTAMMAEYRREWMRQFVLRDPRIFDAQMLVGLRQGTAFFASTSLIALGGVLAMIGNVAPLRDVAEGLMQNHSPVLVWQIKLLAVVLLLAHAFFKFVWANRVFGYCAVMMGAVPTDPADPVALPRAMQAAELNVRAAGNFNNGLRSMYFALAALAWLLGPVALIVAVLAVVWLLLAREFRSGSHQVLTKGS